MIKESPMTKCANCAREAVYLYQLLDNFKLYYCQNHLPSFLWESRDAGVLNIPVVVEPEVVEETPKSKKKVSEPAPVVEEPVVEEPVVEETVVEDATN
jgi:hypothetical protein